MSTLYRGLPIDVSYQISVHLAYRFQRRRILKIGKWETRVACGGHVCERIWPIRNKNCLWRPCFLMDWDKMSNLYRGPSIDASYQVSEKIKMWKVSGRRTPSNGKSSHFLWQGELKMTKCLSKKLVICYVSLSKTVFVTIKSTTNTGNSSNTIQLFLNSGLVFNQFKFTVSPQTDCLLTMKPIFTQFTL